ncbi:hypothetical protein LMH66_17925 [Shewanella sp. 10N.7]|uniref:hypothetical protein n=1 Tax=Shewanella sp. 10N.7 TaxID=2885093 RepID=UPI001E547EB2|nr:hypothetical protein [Shewanella sp. 10N.7]MCC4834528.1 hypothetical protein [Shewanella sp. 10N.7]
MTVELPLKNVFYSYDLEVGDLVAPYGNGKEQHINLLIRGVRENSYVFDEQLILNFPKDGDGALEVEQTVNPNDVLKKNYKLDTFYDLTLSKHSKILTNGNNKEISWSYGKSFTDKLTYVFRLNSKINSKDKVIEANYAYLIEYPQFFIVDDTGKEFYSSEGVVRFAYYFNPVVNDLDVSYDFVQSK